MPFLGQEYFHDWEKLSAQDQADVAAKFPVSIQLLLIHPESFCTSSASGAGRISDQLG